MQNYWIVLTAVLFFVIKSQYEYADTAITWIILEILAIFLLVLLTLGPLVTFLGHFAIFVIVFLLDVSIILPMAWILERKSMGKMMKGLSFLLLCVGFMFDLLSS